MKFFAGLAVIATVASKSTIKVRQKLMKTLYINFQIIGGSVPDPGSEAYIVSLQKSYHFCGGTIVSSDRVISAAHCKGSSVTAVGGAHNINENEPSQQRKTVSSWVNHPKYNSNTFANDIAVLKLRLIFKIHQGLNLLRIRLIFCVKFIF